MWHTSDQFIFKNGTPKEQLSVTFPQISQTKKEAAAEGLPGDLGKWVSCQESGILRSISHSSPQIHVFRLMSTCLTGN